MNRIWAKRLFWGTTGLAWFLWLGLEDSSPTFVLVLAALVSASVVLGLPLQEWGWTPAGLQGYWRSVLLGFFSGAVVPILATLLMFMKVSLHSHSQPDFSIRQILAVLKTIHIWGLSGGLIGLAWAVLPVSNE